MQLPQNMSGKKPASENTPQNPTELATIPVKHLGFIVASFLRDAIKDQLQLNSDQIIIQKIGRGGAPVNLPNIPKEKIERWCASKFGKIPGGIAITPIVVLYGIVTNTLCPSEAIHLSQKNITLKDIQSEISAAIL